jgi:outer membrane receptor protein involved in Fe transport
MLAVSRDRTDGFRENGGGTLTRSALGLGYTFAAGSRLALNLRSTGDDFGAPGALTPQELAADSFDSPFNSLDNSDLTYRQATLLWNGHVGGPFSLAANLTYESRDSTALTTGRSAATFGGFILDDTVRGMNGVVQSTAQARTGALRHMFVFGAEGSRGTNDADGCGTSPSSLTTCDPSSFLNSSNSTTREDLAGFAQDTVDLGRGFGVLGGVRWDQSKYDYTETLPNPANDQSMSFSQTSWKAGVTWNPSLSAGLYASYGESFQPPTVEDLFAFPGFGSNPDLAPANAKNYEVGLRGGFGSAPRAAGAGPAALEYTVSFYRTNLTNEIIFVALPTPGNPFGGQNQNAAESRRQGAELNVN